MRNLRWAGLVFSLSIVGVLGGLMAALPSEAQQAAGTIAPTNVSATMQVDTGTTVSILGSLTACTAAEITLGYNWCYNLLENASAIGTASNKTRKFTLKRYSDANLPRLLISDFKNLNDAKVTGYIIEPLVNNLGYNGTTLLGSGWTYNEAHKVTLKYQLRFNSTGNYAGCSGTCQSNRDDGGTFYIPYGAGGQYETIASCGVTNCSPSNNVNSDKTEISVKGDFIPQHTYNGVPYLRENIEIYNSSQNDVPTSSTSPKPHYHQEATNVLTGTQYSKYDHPNTYPDSGECRISKDPNSSNYNICEPTLKYTQVYNIWGPDKLRSEGSGRVIMMKTDLCFKPQGPPTNNPNNPCKNQSGKKTTDTQQALAAILIPYIDDEITFNNNEGFVNSGQECTEANNSACQCADDRCRASYKHVLVVTPAVKGINLPFTFTGKGPGMVQDSSTSPPVCATTITADDVITPCDYIITPTATQTEPGVPTAASLIYQFTDLPSFGGTWNLQIKSLPPHPDSGKKFELDTINCVSQKYGTLATKTETWTDWTEPSGSDKTGHDVLALAGGDVLTCTWHIHTKSLQQ